MNDVASVGGGSTLTRCDNAHDAQARAGEFRGREVAALKKTYANMMYRGGVVQPEIDYTSLRPSQKRVVDDLLGANNSLIDKIGTLKSEADIANEIKRAFAGRDFMMGFNIIEPDDNGLIDLSENTPPFVTNKSDEVQPYEGTIPDFKAMTRAEMGKFINTYFRVSKSHFTGGNLPDTPSPNGTDADNVKDAEVV